MKTLKVYCPASVSLFFRSHKNKDILKTGSTGIGFTIDKGVWVTIKKSREDKIIFNGKKISFPTVTYAKNSLTEEKIIIYIKSGLPLGFGFGISSASTIASVFAINVLLKLKKSRKSLIDLSHEAEIKNLTGLGSVGTQVTGGFLLKTSPGFPVKAKKFDFTGKKLFAQILKARETSSVLKDENLVKKINKTADNILQKIRSAKPSLEDFLDLSYEYGVGSCLIHDKEIIDKINSIKKEGGHATTAMIGDVIISNIKPGNLSSNLKRITITDKPFDFK